MYYFKGFLLLIVVTTFSGCSALTPITTALHLGEAQEAIQKDKEQPTIIETKVTKKNGRLVVESDSSKSVVGDPILNPEMKPSFDPEKAVSSVPTWLKLLVGVSGLLLFINTVRHHYNKKKEVKHDSNGTDYHGWRRTYGWLVQIYGSSPKEQSGTTETFVREKPIGSGTPSEGTRISYRFSGRSGE